MKKQLFPLALCALAVASCTSSDVIEEGIQTNAIGFENVIHKPSRAIDDGTIDGDLTPATLDNVYVYGYYTATNQAGTPVQVFDGTALRKQGSGWTYDHPRYWVPGAKYYFYAYSCADIALNNTYGTPTLDLINDPARVLRFTGYICDDHHQHDLIYAFNEGITGNAPVAGGYANDPVNFKFNHILTKINAVFSSDFDSSYNVEISNIKVVNIRNQGNYNPKSSNEYGWESVDRNTSYAAGLATSPQVLLGINGNNIAVKGSKTVTTRSAYVIPYNYQLGDVQLTFRIVVKDAKTGEEVLSRNLSGSWSPNWKKGYSYTYNIKITGTAANLEEIRFGDMNIDGWVGDNSSATDVDITFSAN